MADKNAPLGVLATRLKPLRPTCPVTPSHANAFSLACPVALQTSKLSSLNSTALPLIATTRTSGPVRCSIGEKFRPGKLLAFRSADHCSRLPPFSVNSV